MGRLSGQTGREWTDLAADALLIRARKIAAGIDDWAGPGLRTAFLSRIAAGEDPLGDLYSATCPPHERRSTGATLTPAPIVRAIIDLTQREAGTLGSPARIIDPGAGSGRFTLVAAKAFPNARLVAVENDPKMLALLRANLRATGLSGRVQVIEKDFRAITISPVDGPTVFVGNPPYVRHHSISPAWKRWYVDACAKHSIKASQLAGLHLHFFAKVAELGRDGDFGCFITAAEWLDVGYGAALRSLLTNGLGGSEIHILEPTAEAFPGTMTTVAITGFRIGRRPPQLRVRRVERPSDLDQLEGGRTVSWSQASKALKWSLLVYPERRPSAGMIELGEIC